MRDWRDERIAQLETQFATKDARIAGLEQQVASLMKQVAELADKLGQNSRNSHLPPSSDSRGARKQRKRKSRGK